MAVISALLRGSFRHDATPSLSALIITICFLLNIFFLHFRVRLGMESPCCPREHVAHGLTMQREHSLRLLYPGAWYVSVPRRRPRKSIFPIAQPSSYRSSTRPRKQRPPSLLLVCLPPPYSTRNLTPNSNIPIPRKTCCRFLARCHAESGFCNS